MALMPGRTTRPVIMIWLLLLASRLVDAVLWYKSDVPHDPDVAGDASFPAATTLTTMPRVLSVAHAPVVSPGIVATRKFHPAATVKSRKKTRLAAPL